MRAILKDAGMAFHRLATSVREYDRDLTLCCSDAIEVSKNDGQCQVYFVNTCKDIG